MPPSLSAYGPTVGPLGFPMPNRQARQLDTLLKALPKSKEHTYRKAVTAKTPTELNPASVPTSARSPPRAWTGCRKSSSPGA